MDGTSNDDRPERRSIRLRTYDYASAGGYFITVCSRDMRPLFGFVEAGEVRLGALGRIVDEEWRRTELVRPNLTLDRHVVMPNHFHAVCFINPTSEHARAKGTSRGNTLHSPSQTLGAIVRGFKAATTSRIRNLGNPHYADVWQRNYHEHVIRSEEDLQRAREYIATNPLRWELDRYHVD